MENCLNKEICLCSCDMFIKLVKGCIISIIGGGVFSVIGITIGYMLESFAGSNLYIPVFTLFGFIIGFILTASILIWKFILN